MRPCFFDPCGGFEKVLWLVGVDGALPSDKEWLGAHFHPRYLHRLRPKITTAIHQLIDGVHPINTIDTGEPKEAVDHRLTTFVADDCVDIPTRPMDDLD
jgi:hypothetical protein|tara:strand:+ start:91331 stop:91627 length:297 start_codon:yes stop_codon:yes gene_type:complete